MANAMYSTVYVDRLKEAVPATTINTGTRLERLLRCDEHSGHPYPFEADLPYAAALRLALALLAADQSDAKAGRQ